MKAATLATDLLLVDRESTRTFLGAVVVALTVKEAVPVSLRPFIGASPNRLVLPPSVFTFVDNALVVAGLPPLEINKPRLPANHRLTHLAISIIEGNVSMQVYSRRKRKPSKGPSGTPRLHGQAAIFVTDKVKPRCLSGGLPSLGKGAK